MDIATIVGFIAAITCLMVGIGSNLPSMIDPPSMIIVVGGTLAATLIANPLQEVIGLIGVIKCAILVNVPMPTEIIERIVGFAETARREGILSLEAAIEEGDDPFLSTGVRLAVDGTEPDLIMDILETELQFVEERHKQGQEIIANMGNAAPAFGMIGTLIGLVIMLKNMDDPAAIGPGMAIALLTTMYGAILANIIFGPISAKLKVYSSKEVLAKRMIIEGIMSIQSGDNPRIVEHKLSVFLSPKVRPSSEEEEREAA
ncbi:MAG: motility protein A [Gemmatimonadetes bacterium]|jgi:chemotaxis protein MotA|nr:motility protein A [Gemmatimonadota bacterium]MDP7364946.1 motility protein A [Candidatus Latescibacterota bacterium]MDP7635623.1 motility protein A [Candidatus Latescibacterota bacterium]|tara:strand:+ start:401 stop:1177 length:777 start_codon:yes stop_codon:yes gene_type:complete